VGDVLAVLAPGQGSQRPGQLLPWLEVPGVRHHVAALGFAAGLDLVAAGTDAPAEALTATEVTQPLVVATALAAARSAGGAEWLGADVLAGHSVGEWAACALAGVLDDEEVLHLVAVRARAMGAACLARSTGMSAVLGGDRADVLRRFAELGLEAANDNGPGQLVAGGTVAALDALGGHPPTGARVRRLAVAGAFHTAAMAGAVAPLAEAVARVSPRDPRVPLLSCLDGAVVRDGAEVLSRLVAQVAAPVRFDKVLLTLERTGVDRVLELPPAGTLAAIARRALPQASVTAVSTPDDLRPDRGAVPDQRPARVVTSSRSSA